MFRPFLFASFFCFWITLSFAQPGACSSPTPGESCADACLACVFGGAGGTTAGFGADGASGFCGSIENDQWYAFIAPATSITLTLTYANCANGQGIEMGLYPDCGSGPIECGFSPGTSGTLQFINAQVVVGDV